MDFDISDLDIRKTSFVGSSTGRVESLTPDLLNHNAVVVLATIDHAGDDPTDFISIKERNKADRYRYISDRMRSELAHGLKRQCLSLLCERPAKDLHFDTSLYGKPELISYPEVRFNLSHSGRWVALVFSRQAVVGIDIEFPRLIHRGAVARQVLSQSQYNDYTKLGNWQRFLGYWTQKEAISKALGYGLHMGYRSIECTGRLGSQWVNTPCMTIAASDGAESPARYIKKQLSVASYGLSNGIISIASTLRQRFSCFYYYRGDFHSIAFDRVTNSVYR